MRRNLDHRDDERELFPNDTFSETVDYGWFATRFQSLFERLKSLENTIHDMDEKHAQGDALPTQTTEREYYSVAEFAVLVERNEYTVREWCRLARIHAQKCETGRGEAKSWKIPVTELQRYRDHGLLPAQYLR